MVYSYLQHTLKWCPWCLIHSHSQVILRNWHYFSGLSSPITMLTHSHSRVSNVGLQCALQKATTIERERDSQPHVVPPLFCFHSLPVNGRWRIANYCNQSTAELVNIISNWILFPMLCILNKLTLELLQTTLETVFEYAKAFSIRPEFIYFYQVYIH